MDEITIQDNGESEVQITTIGEVVGSDSDGNPITQNFSEEALQKVAETQKDEILVDSDHSSENGGSTEAKGWLSKLTFKKGIGLMGTIKWTNIGRRLIENRVFRWLSPSWILNDKKEPMMMTSCALTNKPSQYGRIDPIINSKSNKQAEDEKSISITDSKKDTDNMNKDELNALVVEMVKKALDDVNKAKLSAEISKEVAEEAAKQKIIDESLQTETKEEVKNEEQTEAEVVKKEAEAKAENSCTEDKTEVKNEEVPEKKEEEKEVIKAEVLNSSPVTVGTSVNGMEAWRNLKGEEFFKYLRAHPEIK